jgi:hypothetical protein
MGLCRLTSQVPLLKREVPESLPVSWPLAINEPAIRIRRKVAELITFFIIYDVLLIIPNIFSYRIINSSNTMMFRGF